MRFLIPIFCMCYSLAVFSQEIPVTARRGLLLSKGATTLVLSSPHVTSVVLLNSEERVIVNLRTRDAGNESWSSFELIDGENHPYASGFMRVVGRHTFHLVRQLAEQEPRPTVESLRNVIDALESPCEPVLINSQSTELLVIEDHAH